MSNQYTFNVPQIGVVRIKAADLQEALMEVADAAGIKLTGMVQKPASKRLRVVHSSPKRVTHR